MSLTETGPVPALPATLPRRLLRYFAATLHQGTEDGVWLTASALAFVTVLSLIPLLTAFSFVGARVFSQYPQRSLEVFVQILPYTDKTVIDKIHEFLDQAETIHGVGVLAFFATTLFLFSTVEESLNRIWNVSSRRPWRVRLLSFLLLLFWGPLLVGATFTSLILLRQRPGLRLLFEQSFFFSIAPFLATVVGLTTLYWLVPYTKVLLRNALAGGLLAGILLELVRQGFASYVQLFRNVNVVYGSYAFAMIFMISIELTWTIILLGSEAAYCAQHFRVMARGMHRNPPVQASWVGLAALALLAQRYARGETTLTREELADRLSLPGRELDRILKPLVVHDLLRKAGSRSYLLAADPRNLSVERVLAAYDQRARRGVELAGGQVGDRLDKLICDLSACRAERLGELTVDEVVAERTPEGGDGGGASADTGNSRLPSPEGASTIPASRTVGQ